MSGKPKSGGSAFPTTPENETRMNGIGGKGMSLRDWFAGQALMGLTANADAVKQEEAKGPELRNRLAEACYAIAGAMLEERAK